MYTENIRSRLGWQLATAMQSAFDLEGSYKTFVTLTSAYVFAFGFLFAWGYWSTFSVDFLAYISLADVIRLGLVPLLQVLIFVLGNAIALSIIAVLTMNRRKPSAEMIVVPGTHRIEIDWVRRVQSFFLVALPCIGIAVAAPAGWQHAKKVKQGGCVHPKELTKGVGCYRFEGVLGGTYFFLAPNAQSTVVLQASDALPLEIPITDDIVWWPFPSGDGGPGPVPVDSGGGLGGELLQGKPR